MEDKRADKQRLLIISEGKTVKFWLFWNVETEKKLLEAVSE